MECSRTIVAIDPGLEQSAALRYTPSTGAVDLYGILPNEAVLAGLCGPWQAGSPHLAVEMVASYGMPVGRDVFETVFWIGRFFERWSGPRSRVYRKDVKMHLCASARAKDANIRQALLDRFGPGKAAAVGTKKAPGPLFGVKADLWAALAVAVTFSDVCMRETAA